MNAHARLRQQPGLHWRRRRRSARSMEMRAKICFINYEMYNYLMYPHTLPDNLHHKSYLREKNDRYDWGLCLGGRLSAHAAKGGGASQRRLFGADDHNLEVRMRSTLFLGIALAACAGASESRWRRIPPPRRSAIIIIASITTSPRGWKRKPSVPAQRRRFRRRRTRRCLRISRLTPTARAARRVRNGIVMGGMPAVGGNRTVGGGTRLPGRTRVAGPLVKPEALTSLVKRERESVQTICVVQPKLSAIGLLERGRGPPSFGRSGWTHDAKSANIAER
jgi:hypothetical protein